MEVFKVFRYLLFLFAFSLYAADPIGKVTAVEGSVSALLNEQVRSLAKGTDIFEKEKISVSKNSRAQIQFTDGGLLNLVPETEFIVSAYRYRKVFEKDRFSGNFLKGGFRMLSGSIAKKNPSEFEIETPTATIGLRGTIVEASISQQGVLFVGILFGKGVVTNSAGQIQIGRGEDYPFTRIASSTAVPIPVSSRPNELQSSQFVAPPGGISINQTQQAQTQQTQTNQEATQTTTEAATEESSATSDAEAEATSTSDTSESTSDTESATTTEESSSTEESPTTSTTEESSTVDIQGFESTDTTSTDTLTEESGGGSVQGGC